MKFLKTLLASALGTLLAFGVLLFFGFLFLIALAASADQKPSIVSNSILTVDLQGGLRERVSGDPLSQLLMGEAAVDLHSMTLAIETAATDPKIKGIWIRTNGMLSSWASLEAVRRSLEAFKTSGKPVYATSRNQFLLESEYFVASVADSVFLEPESLFEFNGFTLTSTFYGSLFEKLGVEAEIVRAGKYKGAVEAYTRSDMSAENKEQMQALLDGIERSFVSSVSVSRNLTEDNVRAVMDSDAFFSSRSALDNKLIDGLKFDDEVRDMLKVVAGTDSSKALTTVNTATYAAGIRAKRSANKIAVVHVTGTMLSGAPADSPLTGGGSAGSETIAKAIQQARAKTGVKAMVIRINSPGGYAPAGDAMLREIERTAEEMPVVISMGDMAASGGYWIATGGSRIFAEKNTITGSIGVFSMFFNLSGLVEDKLGITFDNVTTGPYADMFSGMRSYSDAERAMLNRATDGTYQAFLSKVAASRGLSVEAVQEIAQGRVWTGEDAITVGLVDEIGGLEAALAFVSAKAGIENNDFEVVKYPVQKTFLDQLMMAPVATAKTVAQIHSSYPSSWITEEWIKARQFVSEPGTVQAFFPYSISIR